MKQRPEYQAVRPRQHRVIVGKGTKNDATKEEMRRPEIIAAMRTWNANRSSYEESQS